MAYDDIFEDARATAEERATLDFDDPEERAAFEKAFNDIMVDEDGNLRDSFPSASDVDPKDYPDIFDFLDEYDLWDEFRDDWEESYQET